MELASVIIPIYNVETYIERCIKSLLVQTYKELQIIIIDDGSTDRSLAICEEYSSNYPNIEVHHTENRGVSSARNYGLRFVKGKYVFFVDGDDYVTKTYIEHFMCEKDYDYVAGGYHTNSLEGREIKYNDCCMSIDEYKSECRNNWNKVPSVVVWGNRYKANIIQKNRIRFDEECKIGEDTRFNVEYLSYSQTIKVVDNTEYVYCARPDSALRKYWPERLEEEKNECILKEKLLGEAEDFDWIKFIHWNVALEHYYLFAHKKGKKKHARKKLKETINNAYFRMSIPYIKKNGTIDMKIEAACLQMRSYNLFKKILKSLNWLKRRHGK